MKADITSRADIEKLLTRFYEQVRQDPSIGFIFTDIMNVNWKEHIPLIADFWETILLDNPVYKKNAMEVHYEINKKIPLTQLHFDSWLTLFFSTVNEMYDGPVAMLAKDRAKSIASMMLLKMDSINGLKKM